jgi:hypothetical protein
VQWPFVCQYHFAVTVSSRDTLGIFEHFDRHGDEGLGVVVSTGFGGGLLGAEASGVVVESCVNYGKADREIIKTVVMNDWQ